MRGSLGFGLLFCCSGVLYGSSVDIPIPQTAESCNLSKDVSNNLVVSCYGEGKGQWVYKYSPRLAKIPSDHTGPATFKREDDYSITDGTYTYSILLDGKPPNLDHVSTDRYDITLRKEVEGKKVWEVSLEKESHYQMVTSFKLSLQGDILVILPIWEDKTFISLWKYSDEGELLNKQVFSPLLFDSRQIQRTEFAANNDMWALIQEDLDPEEFPRSKGCLRRGFLYKFDGEDFSIKDRISLGQMLPMVADMTISGNGDIYVLSRNWVDMDSIYSPQGQIACGDGQNRKLTLHRLCGIAGENPGECNDTTTSAERKTGGAGAIPAGTEEMGEEDFGENPITLTGNKSIQADLKTAVRRFIAARSKSGYWALRRKTAKNILKLKLLKIDVRTIRKTSLGLTAMRVFFTDIDKKSSVQLEFSFKPSKDGGWMIHRFRIVGALASEKQRTSASDSAEEDDAAALWAACSERNKNNLEKSLAVLKALSEKGNIVAKAKLGSLYLFSYIVAADCKEGVKLLTSAGKAGSRVAAASLARMYSEGRCGKKDLGRSVEWAVEAAKKDEQSALFRLAVYHEKGIGVRQDDFAAYIYYLQAICADSYVEYFKPAVIAARRLGPKLDDRINEIIDRAQAIMRKESPMSLCVMGSLYTVGTPLPMDNEKANEWFEKAAALGNTYAQYNLGLYYHLGPERDHEKAFVWWSTAAHKKHGGAMYELGRLYGKGEGVDRDIVQAHAWLLAARDRGYGTNQEINDAASLLSPEERTASEKLAEKWIGGCEE